MGKDGNEKGLHVCYSWMVGERRGNQDSVLYSALWPTFTKEDWAVWVVEKGAS